MRSMIVPTAASPLRHFGVRRNSRIAVVGLGGLGPMAVKFAKALGANATVMSHSPGKREDAMRLSADDFVSTGGLEALQKDKPSFDFVVDTNSARHDFNAYLNLLRFGGTMMLLGVPEPSPLAPSSLQPSRRILTGSNVGGPQDTGEMLDFCVKHGIDADVEVIPIQRIEEAFDRTVKGDVRYRFVIDIEGLRGS